LTDLAASLGETALKYFRNGYGYSCAQTVLLTMAGHWKIKNELIPRVASCFGGGMGMCGSVCGAVSGGLMAIGIKCGTDEPFDKSMEKSTRAYELGGTFYRRFEKQNGSVMCRELTGLDLTDAEQQKKAWDVFQKKCTGYVKNAVEILASLNLDKV